jgi:putative ABC transport system permease protein
MTFLALIFKNIWRHKIRTLLTVFGISIGIATIVVFGLVTSGLEEMIGGMIKPGKTDFTVAKASAADFIVSFLSNEQVEKVKNAEGVEETASYVMSLAPLGGNPYFVIGGMDADKIDLTGGKIIEGKAYTNDQEIIIGKITAKNKNLKVGDKLELNKKKYLITGIFESGISFQDSGALGTVTEAQKIQGVTDKVTMVMAKVKKGYNIKEVAKKIEKEDPGLVSIVDLEDFDAVDQGRKIMNATSWIISLLAIIIGGIGVMNTIIMSVFERTHEIGVLRALGWHRSRVILMILGESILLGILAVIIGITIGFVLIWLVMQTEIGQSWLQIRYEPIIFIRALAVSLVVVLIGACYPAYKASRLQPTEALRYE